MSVSMTYWEKAMKAILVIDVDDDVNRFSADIYKEDEKGNGGLIKSYCPLKPIPNRIDWLENGYSAEWVLFSTGWNACLEEIQK